MPDLDVLAFLDESNKPVRDPATGKVSAAGNHYVISGVVVLRGDAPTIRRELLALRAHIGHHSHYADLT